MTDDFHSVSISKAPLRLSGVFGKALPSYSGKDVGWEFHRPRSKSQLQSPLWEPFPLSENCFLNKKTGIQLSTQRVGASCILSAQ